MSRKSNSRTPTYFLHSFRVWFDSISPHSLQKSRVRAIFSESRTEKLTVVLDYYEAMEAYSRIGLLRSYGNLHSYWTTTKLLKLTVVLDYCEAIETYSRIGLLLSHGNLQSYWTTTKLWKLTVVLNYYEAMETFFFSKQSILSHIFRLFYWVGGGKMV